MSFATAQLNPTVRTVFLAEITAGLWCRGMIVHSGSTYKIATTRTISGVTYAGATALTAQTSIANVDANAGSWYSDGSYLYIRPPSGATAYSGVYLATVTLKLANVAKIHNATYYEPRLISAPRLSLRIEKKLEGIIQIGGGRCTLANADGYFDNAVGLVWNAGTVRFLMGIDTPAEEMAYADYTPIGAYSIDSWDVTDREIGLNLVEPKSLLETEIPLEVYTKEAYPSIRPEDVGRPIQIAWGTIYGAKPVCTDPGAKTFKLAGHAVKSIEEVRVRVDLGADSKVWRPITPTAKDVSTATFTLGDDWDGQAEVAVDFIGKLKADGSVMVNPADVVADICETVGIDVDNATSDAAFDAARAVFDLGEGEFDRTTSTKIGIYLDTRKPAKDVVSQINTVANSYLFHDFTGSAIYRVWLPSYGTTVSTFTEADIRDASMSQSVNTRDVFSSVVVRFARHLQEEYDQLYSLGDSEIRNSQAMPVTKLTEVAVPLYDLRDVRTFARRYLDIEGRPSIGFKISVPWQAFLYLPGDSLRITYTRSGFDRLLKVVESNHDFFSGRVDLVCSTQSRTFDSQGNPSGDVTYGIWADAGQASWSSSWTSAEKATNRGLSGFWLNADGFADATDAESFIVSRWN